MHVASVSFVIGAYIYLYLAETMGDVVRGEIVFEALCFIENFKTLHTSDQTSFF